MFGVNGYVSRTQNGETGYFMRNAHGDILKAYGEDNTLLADYTYDAWGNGTKEDGSWGQENPIRYAGEYTDSESGMIYLRARCYTPELGRFITEDPIKDGLNWYAYCDSNPVMHVDPSGLKDVMVKYAIERNGGKVEYDSDNNQAVVTLYGKTVRYNLTDENVVNGRLMLDTSVLMNDFNLSEDTYLLPQPGDKFDSTSDAAIAWAIRYYDESVKEGVEYGSVIYEAKDGTRVYWSFAEPQKGVSKSVSVMTDKRPPHTKLASVVHGHLLIPNTLPEEISVADRNRVAERAELYEYMISPSHSVYRYYSDGNKDKIGWF